MAMMRLPAYVRATKLSGGRTGYYWELPPWARPERDPATGAEAPRVRHGRPCLLHSEALGADLAAAIVKADLLNTALAEWRTGHGGGEAKILPGSVDWLFAWYRDQERFRKNAHKTRADYSKLMNMLAALDTKGGQPLGRRAAKQIDATSADKLYARLRRETGERQATYAMQVCRLIWTWAVRHKRTTGVTENPFAGMGLKSTAAKGNRPTSRTEYDLYRKTARALGFQSMATAAALVFECCQRVSDAFGFEDPDDRESRGIPFDGYVAGERITLVQAKTGNLVVLPLYAEVPGEEGKVERVPLYPELEEELARAQAVRRAGQDLIVVEERSGQPYKERRMSTVHRAICVEAKLPKSMTFTGFRHGGITELGDAGVDDVRAVSGHKTLAVTAIYNKASEEKARRIAATRRAHVEALGALDGR
ncbi:MAG TPA: tyrosine-type recombinase/integrase [Sphingomonas sp.]|jgi:hypothetical protein|uniref:tyrosine-type recombinase/integrase n=1 Tax=Sphingomonas sp. TaxID=28214 RepID=UPI002ED8AD24